MGVSTLSLGEKLRLIRKDKGLSLENVAHGTNSSVAVVSRIERGQTECSAEMLSGIKKCLGIENAPLLAHEVELYTNRLWIWSDIITTRRFDEARAMVNEMSVILDLPFERNLLMLYSLVEMRLIKSERNGISRITPKVHEIEAFMEANPDAVDDNVRLLYHNIKGLLYFFSNDRPQALEHHLLALKYITEAQKQLKTRILLNIAILYYELGKYFHSMVHLESCKMQLVNDRTSPLVTHVDALFVACYICIGEYVKAEDLVKDVLTHAKSIKDLEGIAVCMGYLGHIYTNQQKFNEAIACFDESLSLYDKFEHEYSDDGVLNCYENKAKCLMHLKQYRQCEKILADGEVLCKDNGIYAMEFKAMRHLLALSDKNSAEYIETVAIPYFKDNYEYNRALWYCEQLEANYKKKGPVKKVHAIATISRDIYKAILSNQ